jgi:PAS domain S-box-containing protein
MPAGGRRPIVEPRLVRVVAVPAVLFVVLAALTSYLGVHEQRVVRERREAVERSHQMVMAGQALQGGLRQAEAARRQWLLRRDRADLLAYDQALAAVGPELSRLAALTPAEPSRAAALADIRRTLDGGVRDLRAAAAGGPAELAAAQAAFSQVQAEVAELTAREEALLARRRADYEDMRNRTFVLVMAAAAAAMAGLAYALYALIGRDRLLARRAAERDAARAAQRESDLLYRTMFAHAADYLFVVDIQPDGRFVLADINPALERAIGRPAAELRGRDYDQVTPPDTARLLHQHYAGILKSGQPATHEDPIDTVDGPRICETTLVPVFDEGRIARLVGFGRDVSARARAEEQIRRSQRMEAVGQLTGGVAHDFNNLLQVIRANLEMLQKHVSAGDEAATQRIQSALRGADQAAQLTRQLLAFARRQALEPKPVNLAHLLDDVADLLRRSVGEAVELETVVQEGLWNTLIDPAQVETAILNLALNARDAMPRGGRLTLELSNAALGEEEVSALEEVEPGDYVLLSMRDTGHGMAPEVLARVFEPFFTTKGEEKGTGLGLSMVYGFVKQSRGHIQIVSAPGEGSTVRVYLPRSLQAAPRALEPAATAARRDLALVVDDEEAVRAAARGMLEELGYRCLEAADGERALALLEREPGLKLLFTDVVMPGPVKGEELAARARRLRPDLPILLTSGYARTLQLQEPLAEFPLLGKPYGRQELARKVQQALQAVRPVVLVVEDDPLVRLSALDMVEDLGFCAASAAAAGEALDILKTDGRVDILFTDIGLPDMRGNELARSALELRPGLKVVFASGYADDGSAPEGAVWLSKPYEQKQLSSALSRLSRSWSPQRSA